MEKRINKKIETYIVTLKEDLKKKMIELKMNENDEKTNSFLEYLNEYERIVIQKEDFVKRNRLQNTIPSSNRCNAKLQNSEQCTRRKKPDCQYCGTHSKNIPYGSFDGGETSINCKVDVTAVDIKGIIYFIDHLKNVYKTEDILEEKENPRIIAKATCENGIHHIPEFDI
jgi:hypothetical protein